MRKARDKVDKENMDFMKPILITDINILGGPDDPCFGKLYSLDASECNRCGDNEICAIVTAQLNHSRRSKLEAKGNFKDLEEVDYEVERFLKNLVITNNLTRAKILAEKVIKKFQYKPDQAKEIIKRVVKNSKHLRFKKENGKLYIRSSKD